MSDARTGIGSTLLLLESLDEAREAMDELRAAARVLAERLGTHHQKAHALDAIGEIGMAYTAIRSAHASLTLALQLQQRAER